MRVRWFQHVSFEGLGSIAHWMAERGHELDATRLYAGDELPEIDEFDWLVVMGGPMNIYEHDRYPWLVAEKRCIRAAIHAGRRVLGICLGAQLMADALGGPVTRNPQKEIGWFPVDFQPGRSPLFADFPARADVFHWHGDTFAIPPGAIAVASSEACAHQAFVYGERAVGLQFHLEITEFGARDLAGYCVDELVDAPYIQTAEQMLAGPARFDRINQWMSCLLERLEKA